MPSRPAPTSPATSPRANPDWQLDLNEMVLGNWRGDGGNVAEMTLVWGVPLIPGGALVTAELADLAVDQCELVDQRFTLIAPDNYRGDYLDIKLWSPARRTAGGRVAVCRATTTTTMLRARRGAADGRAPPA